jgi:hypothetical protein
VIALALLAGTTAIDAERAFAAMAQREGQWSAFRAYAAEDAVMFFPQPANVQEKLAKAKNPPIAVQWWPAQSYVSCDGIVAVNTGPWALPKSNGYFTTVWTRQGDGGWKWVMDGGDEKPTALPEKPKQRTASCTGTPPMTPKIAEQGDRIGAGASPDRTLQWQWRVKPDGARTFEARLWNGRTMAPVVTNMISAPPA